MKNCIIIALWLIAAPAGAVYHSKKTPNFKPKNGAARQWVLTVLSYFLSL